jgi:PIN domain nuclease of toxin-antitoxin system
VQALANDLAAIMSDLHRDPFDRMLAAQAEIEDIPLVTADPAFRHFKVRVLW